MAPRPVRRLEVTALTAQAGGLDVLSDVTFDAATGEVATLRGKRLTVDLEGKRPLEKTLDAAPTGRAGLWSKADSQVLFDEFRVERL